MVRLKKSIVLSVLCIGVWLSLRSTYTYFFDSIVPELTVQGIQHRWYAGDVACTFKMNKAGNVLLSVDDVPLTKFSAARDTYYPFTVSTEHLQQGEHTLKIEATDKTYRKQRANIAQPFFVDNCPLEATLVQQDAFQVLQGRTLHVKIQTNKEIEKACVKALACKYACFKEHPASTIYECFIPISCQEKPQEYCFSAEVIDRTGNKVELASTFNILGCAFKKQVITVDAQKLQEEKEKGRALAELEQQLAVLAKQSPDEKLWRGSFCTPIEIERVTCEYGTIRTTQERGRYAHNALDVINKPKSVVWSTQDGIVVLKDRFDFSGNTVVVDHGHGILSLFYHLDDFADIQVGQKVAKGNPVGTLGKTGYATGYHLHWEMRIHNMQVDPMQWTQETF